METIIEKYNTLQKQLVSAFADQWQQENGSAKEPAPDKEFPGLGKNINRRIVHNSIYVIEVAELAKKNFLKYGLKGASSFPEVGGRYLRLFGLLNAVFQQKLAVENLLEIYQVEEKKLITSGLNTSAIIDLCQKLGIHTGYFRSNLDEQEHPFEVDELSRPDLEMNKVKLLIKKYEFESIDLSEDLRHFDRKLELTMSFMIGELLKQTVRNQGQYYEQYQQISALKDTNSVSNAPETPS